jgi:hypothetical protein
MRLEKSTACAFKVLKRLCEARGSKREKKKRKEIAIFSFLRVGANFPILFFHDLLQLLPGISSPGVLIAGVDPVLLFLTSFPTYGVSSQYKQYSRTSISGSALGGRKPVKGYFLCVLNHFTGRTCNVYRH